MPFTPCIKVSWFEKDKYRIHLSNSFSALQAYITEEDLRRFVESVAREVGKANPEVEPVHNGFYPPKITPEVLELRSDVIEIPRKDMNDRVWTDDEIRIVQEARGAEVCFADGGVYHMERRKEGTPGAVYNREGEIVLIINGRLVA